MRAMILAAGLGTRLRPLTLKTPKPLLQVGGQALIVHQISNLRRAGIRQIIINHAWLGDQIETYLGSGADLDVEISYSAESEPLETAGGVRKALDWLQQDGDDPFLLVNGDVYTDVEYSQLNLSLADPLQGRLWLVPNPSWHTEGDFHLSNDGLLDPSSGKRYTFAGISLLRPSLFAPLELNKPEPLAPLLRQQIALQACEGAVLSGYWNDVGTPDRLAQVDNYLNKGKIG